MELTGNYIWVALYDFSMSAKEAYGRGIAIINRFTGEINLIDDERIPNDVLSIYFDGENIWLGTYNGVAKMPLINQLATWGNIK